MKDDPFVRVYVAVRSITDENGNETPESFIWPFSDKEYAIDRCQPPIPRRAKKAGGHGDMYEFSYRGQIRELFCEPITAPEKPCQHRRFFVECRESEVRRCD